MADLAKALGKEQKILQGVLNHQRYPEMKPEGTHQLSVEADVERALHLYLIHDTNIIMEDYLHKRLPGATLICSAQHHKDHSRLDMTWSVNGSPILVLEVKPHRALIETDWLRGVVSETKAQEAAVQARKKGERTAVCGNAAMIVQQVTKYAETFPKVFNVLIFDWDSMVLLDLRPGPNQLKWDNKDYFVRYYFNSESKKGKKEGQKEELKKETREEKREWTHRQLLLAAFVNAFSRVHGEENA
ncbi:hypothetical protein C8R47DRAFT_1217674 [Mycena vitilis]|nr:hypothetical protein C8R47DRAFT_1217674 [Mycena vitilis]